MNTIQIKQCLKCLMYKDLYNFTPDKRSSDRLTSRCKQCLTEDKRDRRKQDPIKFKQIEKSKYRRNKNAWREYFSSRYGINPQCQVCDKILTWVSHTDHNAGNNVCWDHRSDVSLKVVSTPSTWLASHTCNERNICKWEEFSFGILCNRCNSSLPTHDRMVWLVNALNYTKGETCGPRV